MTQEQELFNKLKEDLLKYDPVTWCEKYLTLDGKPLRVHGNGYKFMSDLYRYVGLKALEPNAKPLIIVKSRQIGATTLASALEMYFMGSGLFGNGLNPPMRVMHAFPQLEHAAAYSKTKLAQMINASIAVEVDPSKKHLKYKSYMQSLLDKTTPSDSFSFKQFINGNHLWCDSVGVEGDRMRGKTTDILFYDECFPYTQKIATDSTKISIGKLYFNFINNKPMPLIKSYNLETEQFEFKKIINVWKKNKKTLLQIICANQLIKCTPNHRFLTEYGWIEAKNLIPGTLLKTYADTTRYVKSINEDQKQILLGSFLGDGCVRHEGKSRFRLSVIHGIKQKEYCQWKADMFQVKTRLIENNGYAQTQAINFTTKLFGLNKEFPKTKTSCPQWVLDEIDARGIAIWFMDDGGIDRTWGSENIENAAKISTCSFDEDSQIRFVNKFKSLGIECRYDKYDGYYYILFNKSGFNNLCTLIQPYIHDNLNYKINTKNNSSSYTWNSAYKLHGWAVVDEVLNIDKLEDVYDIEIEDNHNFILAPFRGKYHGGPIVHNCQKMTDAAIANSSKILTTAKYGNHGVKVYFGTPLRQGSSFHKRWQDSTQQYYHLGCESCKKLFPLYTANNLIDWEKVWIHGFIVKCTHCGFEQDKREAAERGKWIATRDEEDCGHVGFHINILYNPMYTKEEVIKEKPENSINNTERAFQNEVMGEFYQGDSSPITADEIREKCADFERKMSAVIHPKQDQIVVMGIDYGAKRDAEQLANPEKSKGGLSYSTAVILSVSGAGLLSIEFANKFKENGQEYKKSLIERLYRDYSVQLAIGDIGFSNDFSETLHNMYGDKYLVSRSQGKVNNYVKYNEEAFPKEIVFERDHYIAELYEQLKKGQIRFPYGSYEKIAWLVEHCASMELKASINRSGDAGVHYVKGGSPNDGFAALLNAYIAYKFIITSGFKIKGYVHGINGFNAAKKQPHAILGNISRKF